jgi:predicted DsbA family dithiol-disulfide isomerase
VEEDIADKLVVNWRYFSLEQVNSQQGPKWKIWEQPEGYQSRGLRAFQAAEAAWQQGESAFNAFHITLLKAKHERQRDIADAKTLIEVAESSGLEMERFRKDLSDRRLVTKLASDHTYAVEALGIFGTPTLVFPEKQAVFLKMSSPPPPEECLPIFNEIYTLAYRRRVILEIKRP